MGKIETGIEILPIEFIQQINRNGRLYLVGGAVRDYLITSSLPEELDFLVTNLSLKELLPVLRRWGTAIYVGRTFGVVKFIPRFLDGKELEFSIPKIRGAKSDELAADLAERDFTINSMALDVASGEVIDPFGGREDIARRVIRATRSQNLLKDPLRMFRAIRLAVQLGYYIEDGTRKEIVRNAHFLRTVSPERIRDELVKLLLLPDPSEGFRLMRELKLIPQVIPELESTYNIEQGGYHQFALFEHIIRTVKYAIPDLRVRLAALFHDIAKPVCRKRLPDGRVVFYGHDIRGARITKTILRRLRFPQDVTDVVVKLVRYHMFSYLFSDKGLRRFIRRVGPDNILLLIKLRFADTMAQHDGRTLRDEEMFEKRVIDELNRKPPMTIKELDINGYDIMDEFKLSPGPMVGRILKHLLTYVLDNPERNRKEVLIREAKDFFASLSGE